MRRMYSESELREFIKSLINEDPWISQMKEVFSYDEIHEVITFSKNAVVHNDWTFFDGLVNIDDLTKLADPDDNPFFPSGKVPNLWETEYDFESLPNDLLEKVKVGDIIYTTSDGHTMVVDNVEDTEVILKGYTQDTIVNISYVKENNAWSCSVSEVPLTMNGLTHSFNELDPTIKQIVDDAIADNGENGVACTQAQWNAIKSLLDKSLYLNYGGTSVIKSLFNGIDDYCFGEVSGSNYGLKLELYFDGVAEKLFIILEQL